MNKSAADLNRLIAAHFVADPPRALGVAVSGGSDSVALLTALHDWSLAGGPDLHAVTVDHNLRAESAQEAQDVANLCASLGIRHTTLRWHWDGTGNLPDHARRGRYTLMAGWAAGHGFTDIALGHTQDDLAETFLMRVSRGAGLDGLSAMANRRLIDAVTFHRPMLALSRLALRDMLLARNTPWAEDPSNDNPAYDRPRARQILNALAPLGVTRKGLADVSRNLRDARDALAEMSVRLAAEIVSFDAGDILLTRTGLLDLPFDLQRRLIQAALQLVGNDGYPPRGPALRQALNSVLGEGDDTTLHGCRLLNRGECVRVTREWKAVAELQGNVDQLWDGRWRLDGPGAADLCVAALGEAGLKYCPDRKETGRPAATLIASPAIWRNGTLIAAPLAGLPNGWSATCNRDAAAYNAALLSH